MIIYFKLFQMFQTIWYVLVYSRRRNASKDISGTSTCPHGDQHIAQLVGQVRVDEGLPKEAFHLGKLMRPVLLLRQKLD